MQRAPALRASVIEIRRSSGCKRTAMRARREADGHREQLLANRTAHRLIEFALFDLGPSVRLVIVEIPSIQREHNSVRSRVGHNVDVLPRARRCAGNVLFSQDPMI